MITTAGGGLFSSGELGGAVAIIGAIPMTITRWVRSRTDAPLRVLRHLRGPPRSPEQSGPGNFGRYRHRVSFLASNERVKYTS